MSLLTHYTLDECIDRKQIINKLKALKKDGKLEYELDRDILTLTDIDLEDNDIDDLVKLFDKNDVFPYLEYEDEEEDENFGEYFEDEDDFQ